MAVKIRRSIQTPSDQKIENATKTTRWRNVWLQKIKNASKTERRRNVWLDFTRCCGVVFVGLYLIALLNQWGPLSLDKNVSLFEDNVRIEVPSLASSYSSHPISTDASDQVPKTLVIYFPQYHRDPVNDKNWGDNFTDWVSLRDTPKSNRLGQVIPRPLLDATKNGNDLPPPLGYYDLTDKKPREIQGTLAKKYGIDGFIYHHYWFYDESNPGPTLARPLERMLQDGQPDIPFMLNWCAMRWVNVWMGKAIFQKGPTNKNRAITLQEQYFNATQDMIYKHYVWLKPFFQHPNYIRVNDQPCLMWYHYDARALPILESLRRFAIKDGFPGLHFIAGRSSHSEELYDTSHLPNDKHTLHWLVKARQPRSVIDPTQSKSIIRSIYKPTSPDQTQTEEKIWDYNPLNQTLTYPFPLLIINKPYTVPGWCNALPSKDALDFLAWNDTRTAPKTLGSLQKQQHPEMIGVITTFDNTPRRKFKSASIWLGDSENGETPDDAIERFSKSYEAALYYQKCCALGGVSSSSITDDNPTSSKMNTKGKQSDDRFVVINAWNEWAEGMSIEPSNVYGYRWLETIQMVKNRVKERRCN